MVKTQFLKNKKKAHAMKILFTGKSDFEYNRVRVLLAGLTQLPNIEVILYPIEERSSFNKQEFYNLQKSVDFIYIPPFRHRDVGFIQRISTAPIVFDPLISKYLTKAIDYRHFWKAPMKYVLDLIPFSKCDLLIADTHSHKDFFQKKFKINNEKIQIVPIGIDTSKFYKIPVQTKKDGFFHVGFYGSFVPLQGIPKIIEAANLLKDREDIVFDIIGSGYDYKITTKLIAKYQLKNINLLGWVSYDDLNSHLNNFDICLGIFGDSLKADSVIPNKVFHYAGLGKCMISKDTPGIREIFTNEKDIILCSNSPRNMADQILFLKENKNRRLQIGNKALELVSKRFNHIEIAKKFISILTKFNSSRE